MSLHLDLCSGGDSEDRENLKSCHWAPVARAGREREASRKPSHR